MARERLAGWGRTAWTVAETHTPDSQDAVREVLRRRDERGVIARGMGRSYGAAAQNAGGHVLLMHDRCLGAPFGLEESTGVLRAPAGMSLDDILRHTVPRGWFVPVTPGTRFVTVGGAIASDIHGKNHHVDGSFGKHVLSMRVLLSSGEVVEISPTRRPDWFWATVGGMGLTGLVIDADIQMIRVGSARMRVETERLASLDHVIEAMSHEGADDAHRYSVAWVDLVARGASLGRGVLTRGDHAPAAEVTDGDPLAYGPRSRLVAPGWVPNHLLNSVTVRAFNEVWYRKAPAARTVSIESIAGFFHPLDGIRGWNTLYGTRGFIQYQFIVPLDRTDVMRTIIAEFADAGVASPLAVLKRMGPQNAAPLSFPTQGWTLTLDMAAGSRTLPGLLARVDSLVLDSGGRHYLAKDSHISAAAVRRGYSRLDEWQATADEMDPENQWASDLSRRLALRRKGH